MRALDRKLLRDLRGMRGQAVAIAFVIMAGVASYVAMTSVMESLQYEPVMPGWVILSEPTLRNFCP